MDLHTQQPPDQEEGNTIVALPDPGKP